MSRYRTGNFFFTILELSKVRITVAVAFTTITGYILAAGSYDTGFIFPTLGIFLLACGSSVINHLQEHHSDAYMERTRNRPIPSRKATPFQALVLAAAETIAGSLILFFSGGALALILGLLAMVWYNGIYTNLKRVTPHAVIPGSVIGSIPPLVGWVSAGGNLVSREAAMLALFYFVWQVPHFYLLAVKYGPEYEEAGMPAITSRWSPSTMRRNIFIWIVITALTAFVMAFTPLTISRLGSWLIVAAGITLVAFFIPMLQEKEEPFPVFRYFMRINYFVLTVTILLVAGPFLFELLGF
jgi:protoheme IX farnesyltransferase